MEVEFEDTVFLLSVEEYVTARDNITKYCPVKDWWWLRSPGYNSRHAAFVYPDGSVSTLGRNVNSVKTVVRPACKLSIHESSHLEMGDCIMKYGYPFIKISEKLAIAEFPIGQHQFDEKSNNYEISKISKYLLEWAGK